MRKESSADMRRIFYGSDPLIKLTNLITKRSLSKVAIAAAIFQLVTIIIPGVLISLYNYNNPHFISVFQFRELTMIVVWQLVLPIPIFTIWAWQPMGQESLFKKLQINELFPGLIDHKSLIKFLNENVARVLNSKWTIIISISYLLASIIFGSIPNWVEAKSNPVWWSINFFCYWMIFTPQLLICSYIVIWGAIRQFSLIRALHILFKKFEIMPKIMHPDRCLGFSIIGKYTLICCIPIILFGCGWTVSLILMPITGKNPVLFSTIASIAIYPIFICLFLILPVITPHRVLSKARDETLEKIAIQIRDQLYESPICSTSSNSEKLKFLEYKYQFIQDNFSTWPFQTHALRNFSILAIVPMLPTIIQIITNIIPRIVKH